MVYDSMALLVRDKKMKTKLFRDRLPAWTLKKSSSKPGQQRSDVNSGLAEDVERPEPDGRRGQVHGDQNVPVVST